MIKLNGNLSPSAETEKLKLVHNRDYHSNFKYLQFTLSNFGIF